MFWTRGCDQGLELPLVVRVYVLVTRTDLRRMVRIARRCFSWWCVCSHLYLPELCTDPLGLGLELVGASGWAAEDPGPGPGADWGVQGWVLGQVQGLIEGWVQGWVQVHIMGVQGWFEGWVQGKIEGVQGLIPEWVQGRSHG